MGRINTDDYILKKKKSFKVRVTTRISGPDKDSFFSDLLKKGITESELNSNIIKIHYKIINSIPNGNEMEFIELKKYILDKIKI